MSESSVDQAEARLHARCDKLEHYIAEVDTRVEALERARGRPGTGTCICGASPQMREEWAAREGVTWEYQSKSRFPTSALLDHRCPWHGEKAQSALWGRHKDLELVVTYAQWSSLGVTPEPNPPPSKS